jgi:hypothetical protein
LFFVGIDVDLDVLCSFNILKKMDVQPMEICEAVESMACVSVSPDQKRIRPSGSLPQVFHNTDGRTVYAETFPSNTKHEDIENLFASCGRVVYVSLPRFKASQSIKVSYSFDNIFSFSFHLMIPIIVIEHHSRSLLLFFVKYIFTHCCLD